MKVVSIHLTVEAVAGAPGRHRVMLAVQPGDAPMEPIESFLVQEDPGAGITISEAAKAITSAVTKGAINGAHRAILPITNPLAAMISQAIKY